MLADRNLILLSPERLCQSLTNTYVDVSSRLSMGTSMEDLGKVQKELKGVCNPTGKTTISTNQNPPISYPSPYFYEDVPQPTHYCLPTLAFPYTGAWSLSRTKGLSSH